jgi:hypothetical protein
VNHTDCGACIGDIVDCQACLAMNNSNNGTADCDMLDDGVVNSSCGAPAVCPIPAATRFTQTQTSGGTLKVSGLAAFPFPTGGTVVQDVSAATLPNCVHDTVVPFPGGFSAPVFCIPALQFTVSVTQVGCGVGKIDSNGGSDFTVEEVGDTSSPTTCSLGNPTCTVGADADIQVDVTVGDTVADTCGTGTANAVVSIPVNTVTWNDVLFQCPDGDGMFDGGDQLVTSFPQFLDFTTDATSGDFGDLDADDCCIAGAGPSSHLNLNGTCVNPGDPIACCTGPGTGTCGCEPGGAGPQTGSGSCVDLTGVDIAGADVTTVAAGAIGSDGAPLNDLSFITTLPNAITSSAFGGAVCGSPPAINFAGTATRCIDAP